MLDQGIKWEGQLVVDIYNNGIAGGFRTNILEMTVEAYRTYLAGYIHSPIILSGETLHRLNCEYILQYTKSVGSMEYRGSENINYYLKSGDISGDYKAAESLLDNLTLCDTITLLKSQALIDDMVNLDMHALRYVRNKAVHALRTPRIDPYNPPLPMSKQELHEALKSSLSERKLPLKYRQHSFMIRVYDEEIKETVDKSYIVNQERLGTDVETIEPNLRMGAISLALLFSAMKYINDKLPVKK